MWEQIKESDWKIFRQLRTLALERFCDRVLSEIESIASDAEKGSHERYLAVYRRIARRDKELADAFNNPRRSAALLQLARIMFMELLTEEEFARFSPETREAVGFFRPNRAADSTRRESGDGPPER